MTTIEPLRIQIFNGSFTTLLVLIVLLQTFTNVLGADRDKVHHDQTLGNNNKDFMFDCRCGFQEIEEKRDCLIHFWVLCHVITFTMFSLKHTE